MSCKKCQCSINEEVKPNTSVNLKQSTIDNIKGLDPTRPVEELIEEILDDVDY